MHIEPYLFFEGRADEAIAFYKETLGAEELMLMRFSESPDPVPEGMIPADWGDKVMHACLRVGATNLMISDGGCNPGAGSFGGFSLTINTKDAAENERLYAALSEGGQVTMPLGKTFFAESFAMLTDRFGVPWTLVVEDAAARQAAA